MSSIIFSFIEIIIEDTFWLLHCLWLIRLGNLNTSINCPRNLFLHKADEFQVRKLMSLAVVSDF